MKIETQIKEVRIRRPMFWWVHRAFKTRTFVLWNEMGDLLDAHVNANKFSSFLNELISGGSKHVCDENCEGQVVH